MLKLFQSIFELIRTEFIIFVVVSFFFRINFLFFVFSVVLFNNLHNSVEVYDSVLNVVQILVLYEVYH